MPGPVEFTFCFFYLRPAFHNFSRRRRSASSACFLDVDEYHEDEGRWTQKSGRIGVRKFFVMINVLAMSNVLAIRGVLAIKNVLAINCARVLGLLMDSLEIQDEFHSLGHLVPTQG